MLSILLVEVFCETKC